MKRARLVRGDAPEPVRAVHLGPGAFFRAHQAWYTDGTGWGIAALTQRSDDMVGRLGGQGGLYTVVTRGPDGDSARIVSSVSEVVGRGDPRGVALIADPEVSVVTLTITEAGYRHGSVAIDRLLDGLAARRLHGRPLSVMSCDNLSANSSVLRRRLLDTAASRGHAGLVDWIDTACAWPNSVVDRITPATSPSDAGLAAELTGFDDRAAVVTEPWTEWVIEDAFAADRPPWEDAGALLVADVRPYETRKLRLLNAGHSLLAYVGAQRGHTYVHEAIADPFVHDAVLSLWTEAILSLGPDAGAAGPGGPGGLDAYCAGVEARWTNRRLPHQLVQIGTDGSLKLRERLVATMLATRATSGEPQASALTIGAWIAHLRGHGSLEVRDREAPSFVPAAGGADLARAVESVLRLLDERLAEDGWVRSAVLEAARRWDV